MNSSALPAARQKRLRELITPEGLSLPFTIAGRGARLGALLLDLLLITTIQVVTTLLLLYIAFGVMGLQQPDNLSAVEFLAVFWIIAMFLFRYGYFLYFELGPRGATPGKRAIGIRIAARDGGKLGVDAVIARNLLRDIEIFMPFVFMASAGEDGGMANFFALMWFLIFALFPFFNKDAMRAGDMVAGTFVVETPKHKLEQAMSLGDGARGHSQTTGVQYTFGDAELDVYGEFELQALERVLRDGNEDAMVTVMETICAKIGWNAGAGDERAFLEAFYAQLRARLERGMRFGKRKADKFS